MRVGAVVGQLRDGEVAQGLGEEVVLLDVGDVLGVGRELGVLERRRIADRGVAPEAGERFRFEEDVVVAAGVSAPDALGVRVDEELFAIVGEGEGVDGEGLPGVFGGEVATNRPVATSTASPSTAIRLPNASPPTGSPAPTATASLPTHSLQSTAPRPSTSPPPPR